MRASFFPRTLGLVLGGLFCGVAWWFGTTALYAAEMPTSLPANFQIRTVVSGLRYPTDMVLLPSGDILVVEKGAGLNENGVADVRLVRQGELQEAPVLSLSVTVLGDSGIYSLVLDPDFATNHYFYVWYSAGAQALDWPGNSVDRLSRFTFDPISGQADVQGEQIIVDGIRWSQWHNGGGLAFDAEGNLFIATGDAAINRLAQDMTSLNGKLLRVQADDGGGNHLPTSQAHVHDQSEEHPHAQPQESAVLPEIYASGLRNPFRMAWRPAEQAFYLLDVGFGSWEEVNRVGESGANYGWAVREGPCPYNVRDVNCPPAPPEYTDPVVAYAHPAEGGAGITALAFYSGTAWPELYQGLLFFADFNARSMSMVNVDDPATISPFGSEVGHLVDMESTPDGIYTLSIYEGAIYFIYYSAGGNQWPTAQLNVAPQQGAAPLAVEFSAVGSSDPEQDALTYRWDFGDDSVPLTTTQPFLVHHYQQDGDYLASLQVFDEHGGRSEIQRTTVRVYSGAMPTIVQEIVGDNVGDSERRYYRGGDTVRFTVTREGDTAGLDVTTPYIWTIKQHHNEHVHFVITEYAGDAVEIEISEDSHAAEVTIWYEAELTMLTDQGQAIRVNRVLGPDSVALDVQSLPRGASMRWNGVPQLGDRAIDAIIGQHFVLEAPPLFYHERAKYSFTQWQISHAGEADEILPERSFELLVTSEAKSYVAQYEYVGPAQESFLPSVMRAAPATPGAGTTLK